MNITPISTAKTYAQHLCDGLTLAMHTDGWHQNYWAKESLNKIAALRVALTAAETELKQHLRLAEAKPDGQSGWTYRGLSGLWSIQTTILGNYHAQHDEVTGDGDPAWMFAEASTLIGCLDAIDDVEAENSCSKCLMMIGEAKLEQMPDDTLWCDDCFSAEAANQQALHEMGEDDKAHAAMERAAGL